MTQNKIEEFNTLAEEYREFVSDKMKGEYVFTQICRFLPREEFKYIIKKYKGNTNVKAFKCWNQLLALIFGQLAGCG